MRHLFVLLLLCAPAALAQQASSIPMELPLRLMGTTYDASVPAPADVIGFEAGSKHARPAAIVRYYERVADASPRVTLDTYAHTVEGRPLIQAIVTSPANHARLDAILEANRRLSDSPGSVSDADLAQMPAVVWMGYSVHGNEASGADAALLTLHHLAAGESSEVGRMLDELVIILDPVYNPDGRARFVGWMERYRGPTPIADDQDIEHSEAWPGGRTNHYWFDLNRDWLPAVHPSSEGRLERFHRFRPQFLTDFHEMGGEATYFFQPGIPSRTNPNTPQANQDMAGRIANFHAAILDDIGSLYYSKESFDDFYYGKGSTYPDVNGSVGILFEQASSRALQVETDNNGLLTYPETVRNQFATSISSLRASVDLRTDLLRMQRDFYAGSSDFAREVGLQGYVFGDGGDATRAAHLANLLGKHRIIVEQLTSPLTVDGTRFPDRQLLRRLGPASVAADQRCDGAPDDVYRLALLRRIGVDPAACLRIADGRCAPRHPSRRTRCPSDGAAGPTGRCGRRLCLPHPVGTTSRTPRSLRLAGGWNPRPIGHCPDDGDGKRSRDGVWERYARRAGRGAGRSGIGRARRRTAGRGGRWRRRVRGDDGTLAGGS